METYGQNPTAFYAYGKPLPPPPWCARATCRLIGGNRIIHLIHLIHLIRVI